MNTLSTRPPHTAATPSLPPTPTIDRRVGPIDRLTLRLGLWLLTRHAARVRLAERRAADAHRARIESARRERRERDWYRTAALLRPPL